MSDFASPPSLGADVVEAEYDWDEIQPSDAIVQAVSVAANTDPLELDLLFGSVNTDAINTLLQEDKQALVEVGFSYSGFYIELTNYGTLKVKPQDRIE